MFKKLDFLNVVTGIIAFLGAAVLGAYEVLGVSNYVSDLAMSRQPYGHEAIDGLFIGLAVQSCMVYETVAVGVVAHFLPLLAMGLKRRWLLVLNSLALIAFSIAAVFLALVMRAPILAIAAATSTALGPLSVVAAMRRQAPSPSSS